MIQSPRESTTLPEFFRQISESTPWMLGREIEITTAATSAVQQFPHGLGRAYRGAWQIWTTGTGVLVAQRPTFLTDATTLLSLRDATATAATVRLWVW